MLRPLGRLKLSHTPEDKPFIPVEIEIEKIGSKVIKFALMTPEELSYWWEEGSEHPRHGVEMLGKDF